MYELMDSRKTDAYEILTDAYKLTDSRKTEADGFSEN